MRVDCALLAVIVATVTFLPGCTGSTKRVDLDEPSDLELGTGITSQDFRSIAQRMARSLVVIPQIQNATTPPKVAFISVTNNSNDYIDGEMFLNKMRTELIKHAAGRVAFLDRSVIEQIEKENRDKSRGKRTTAGEQVIAGADFFLTGTIESIDKVTAEGHSSYLRLSFRLVDAGDSIIVWEDDYEVKKHSTTGVMYR